jgi:hypothetical protein
LRLTTDEVTEHGTRDVVGRCAVPWGSHEALAGTPAADDGPPVLRQSDVFAMPGRPDVWLRHGFHVQGPADSVVEVGGPIGPVGWATILHVLCEPSPHAWQSPDLGALVHLQDQGRLDPEAGVAAAVARWSSGRKDGGALGWERAMLRGALRGLWPVAVAIVEAGLARDDRPPEVDALIEVLRRRRHEVPPEHVPRFLETT